MRIKWQYRHVVVYSEILKADIYPELLYTSLVLPSIASALRKEWSNVASHTFLTQV